MVHIVDSQTMSSRSKTELKAPILSCTLSDDKYVFVGDAHGGITKYDLEGDVQSKIGSQGKGVSAVEWCSKSNTL